MRVIINVLNGTFPARDGVLSEIKAFWLKS